MSNLYVKIEDGKVVSHPIVESNLLQIVNATEIDDVILKNTGFARFEYRDASVGEEIVSTDGYELCEDGIARSIVTVRELTQEEKIDLWVRRPRDHFLATSDWTQVNDIPHSDALKAAWAVVRQQLRDMPKKYAKIKNPDEVVWPKAPTEETAASYVVSSK